MNYEEVKNELTKDGEVVTHILEKWAIQAKDRTFIYYGEEDLRLSFHEFNKIANSIAHGLISLGINKGDRVSVFLRNPLVTAMAMFGIWKAGAIFCPINFNYKGQLLVYQINDSDPRAIFIEKDLIPLLNEVKGEISACPVIVYAPKEKDHDYKPESAGNTLDKYFSTETSFDEILKGDTSNVDVELKYMDIASIIYTSGTTGSPKGVVQPYRWMNNYVFNWRRIFNQEDVIYSDLPMYHVAGAFFNLVRALWVGCECAMWDKFSVKDFWNRIQKSGSTSAVLLDVMVPWLMNTPETPDDYKNTLNKVYMAPMPQYHHDVAKRFGLDFVITGFGQTETGSGSICIIDELKNEQGTPPELYKGMSKEEIYSVAKKFHITVVDAKKDETKGILGTPSLLFEASVVNELDEECAPGEPGELVFRPKFPSLFVKEYYNKPEATLKAFRNLWFHTGDACFKNEKGVYFFVDRMGSVIRVKGEFVSSYQVEDIINKHPKVNICGVFPIPAEVGGEHDIVTFIVPKQGEKLDEEELREWIKKAMPKFMWPKYIRFVDKLPETPTSKIEKYKLRELIKKELGIK
ncbi:MAG: AMP-binding protein [Desulfomonilia bacterium]|uniref:Acyl-CoA synthetase/AMP-acid ligase II n=1 Tax=anaerobic digester metagenome TaxID=1263854 RepID=A0A485M416_9ZZZZ|nr:AMP-binding protein [Pseudomonadota bacterium]HQB35342.1 AMP-binding protein [Syntrophorhabdus sp.]HRS54818.1 AMP-binding protein [Desulfomonilia bacterium]HRV34427.1 AMP-binding protein [Desulfomonilia bacterium]